MGGCLSILIAAWLSDIISGIMLQAPAILASTPKNNCLSCFLSCFGCFCPCLTIGERIGDGVENVTRNSYVRNFVMEDEFMYKGKANLKTVKNIVKGMRQASRCAESVKCRVIIFLGLMIGLLILRVRRSF